MTSSHSRMPLRPVALWAVVTACFVGATPLAAQDSGKIDPATWAPKDALAYIGTSDLELVIEKLRKSPVARELSDPAIKSTTDLNVFWKMLDALKQRVAKMLGTEADKLQNPFGGPMAVIVTAVTKDGETVPAVTFVATVKDSTVMRSYYENATKRLKETADSHEGVTMGSATIDHFKTRARTDEDKKPADSDTAESEAAEIQAALEGQVGEDEMTAMMDRVVGELFSSEAMPESLATCLTENRLLVALSPDHIKAVLRSDRGDSLKDHDDYKAIDRKFKQPGPVRLLINVPKIVDLAAAQGDEDFARTRAALGLGCMRSVIGHLEWDGEKYDGRGELLLLTSDDCTGLAKILRMKNAPLAPPKFVTTEQSILFSMHLNPIEILEETERIMRQVDPDAADEMAGSMVVDLPDGKKLDIRKEIIANLQPPQTFSFGFAKPYSPTSARVLLSIGTRGREVFDRLIGLAQESGAPLTERETGGAKVYDIDFGMSVGASRDAMLVGSRETVDTALVSSGSEKWLGDDARFKKLAEFHPREAWLIGYFDRRKLYEAAIELQKHHKAIMSQMFTDPAGAVGLSLLESLAATFDEDKLDDARQLLKYQAAQLMSISTTADGVLFTAISGLPDSD
ncbi:MAG: hypothetical protein ACKVS9_09105 [Phycisphaerae bacterium]